MCLNDHLFAVIQWSDLGLHMRLFTQHADVHGERCAGDDRDIGGWQMQFLCHQYADHCGIDAVAHRVNAGGLIEQHGGNRNVAVGLRRQLNLTGERQQLGAQIGFVMQVEEQTFEMLGGLVDEPQDRTRLRYDGRRRLRSGGGTGLGALDEQPALNQPFDLVFGVNDLTAFEQQMAGRVFHIPEKRLA